MDATVRRMSLPETEKLLMIPGPIEISPGVRAAFAERVRGHLEPPVIEAFGRSVERMRGVWLAGADAQPFVVAGSGTLAMQMAAENLVDPGETVVVVETGFFSERMAEMLRRRGADVVWIAAEPGDAPGPERVATALAEASARGAPASVVFATHVDTSTGVRVDAEGIARVAKASGALVVLDGVCAVAGERLEMEKWGVDVALTGSQKAIGLPPGLALLVASAAAIEKRTKLRHPPGLAVDFDAWRPVMQAYEARKPSYFATPATPLIVALAVGLEELLAGGATPQAAMQKRFEEHARAATAVRAVLASFGVDFVPRSPALSASTLTACWHPEGVGPELVAAIAQQGVIIAGGLHPAIRQKTFRIGHMGHSSRTPEHLLRTIDAVGAALEGAGKSVDRAAARKLAEEKLRS